MELVKPKIFKLPKQEEQGLTIWQERTAAQRPQFHAEIFNEYNIFIGDEQWEVKCSGIHVNMQPIQIGTEMAIQRITFDPIKVEWYECNVEPFQTTELYRWLCQLQDERNIMNYGRLKRGLRFEKIGNNPHNFNLYGAILGNVNANMNHQQRFDIDALLECDIYFDYYEML